MGITQCPKDIWIQNIYRRNQKTRKRWVSIHTTKEPSNCFCINSTINILRRKKNHSQIMTETFPTLRKERSRSAHVHTLRWFDSVHILYAFMPCYHVGGKTEHGEGIYHVQMIHESWRQEELWGGGKALWYTLLTCSPSVSTRCHTCFYSWFRLTDRKWDLGRLITNIWKAGGGGGGVLLYRHTQDRCWTGQ